LFTRTTKAGKEQPFYKITLSDATISSVEGTTTARNGTEDVRNIQESAATEVNTGDPTAVQEIVAFTFRKIQLTDLTTNKTVSFDFADTKITTAVKAKLAADRLKNLVNVGVETNDGVVRLYGKVPTPEDKFEAERVARRTNGVRDVTNELRVEKPDTSPSASPK